MIEPAVAVMVTVDVVVFGLDEPPPHAVIPRQAIAIASTSQAEMPRRFFQPASDNPSAIPNTGKPAPGLDCSIDDCDGAVTVRVTLVAAVGVIGFGLKEQFAPVGRPEQANVMGEVKPSTGVTAMVRVADDPAPTVSDCCDADSEKVGPVTTWLSALEVLVLKFVSPP